MNGKELTNKDNVKFETDAKTSVNFLTITKVLASHIGTYTVKAANNVGEAEHSFNFEVLGNNQSLDYRLEKNHEYQSNFYNDGIKINFFKLESPKIKGKLENVTVKEGEEAKFSLKIEGKPKPTVKWFKEEEEIVTTTLEVYEVVEVEDTITLIIKSAKPENSGNYYAQLVNEAGQINTNKAQLTVNSNR